MQVVQLICEGFLKHWMSQTKETKETNVCVVCSYHIYLESGRSDSEFAAWLLYSTCLDMSQPHFVYYTVRCGGPT